MIPAGRSVKCSPTSFSTDTEWTHTTPSNKGFGKRARSTGSPALHGRAHAPLVLFRLPSLTWSAGLDFDSLATPGNSDAMAASFGGVSVWAYDLSLSLHCCSATHYFPASPVVRFPGTTTVGSLFWVVGRIRSRKPSSSFSWLSLGFAGPYWLRHTDSPTTTPGSQLTWTLALGPERFRPPIWP